MYERMPMSIVTKWLERDFPSNSENAVSRGLKI